LARRALLIEGEACSGKSLLVRELARLAKRELVEISVHEETEVDDLIGQYVQKTERLPILRQETMAQMAAFRRFILTECLPYVSSRPTKLQEKLVDLMERYREAVASAAKPPSSQGSYDVAHSVASKMGGQRISFFAAQYARPF
jgi:ABC-type enterochelin transport system ATPase subunit